MNKSPKPNVSYENFLAFCLSTCMFIALHQLHGITNFPFDSSLYWSLSDPSVFFNFPKTIRGFFYPLLLLPAHLLSSTHSGYELHSYRIISSFIYGYLFTNIVPVVYQQFFGGKLTLARRLIPPFLVAILSPGLVVFPLSDLPAFILLICALHLLLKSRIATSVYRATGFSVLAGMLAAGAYNTRTIYIFSVLLLFLAVPLYFYSRRSKIHKILGTLCFVLGVGLLSAPQSVINHKRHGTWTPTVITQSSTNSLFALQLMWGITMQRYETTIDPQAPTPARYFVDPVGVQLIAAEQLENSHISITNYMALVAKYPIEFLGIYSRHLINGLDLRDGEIYIRNIRAQSTMASVFNFTIVALVLLVALSRYISSNTTFYANSLILFPDRTPAKPSWPLWLLVWLLPVFAILPGAVETRFFFPLHLLLYCTLAFNTSMLELTTLIRRHWMALLFSLTLLGALYFAVSTSTQATLQTTIPLVYRFGN